MRACCAMLLLMPLTLCASVPKTDVRGQRAEVSGQRSEVRGQRSAVSKSVSPAAAVVTPASDPTAAPAASSWHPTPLARYEGILSRMPFGLAPPAPAPANATPATPPPPAFVNKLVLCAINRTPSGNIAVGFVDGNVTPPRSYYMDVGETQDGFTVTSADIDQEFAIIEKDGTSVTLWLNATAKKALAAMIPSPSVPDVTVPGPVATASSQVHTTPTLLARIKKRGEELPPITNAPPSAFTSDTDIYLSSILSTPPGVEPIPLLPVDDEKGTDIKKALKKDIVIQEDDSKDLVAHKETVAWAKQDIREYVAQGGSAKSYLERIHERQAEAARKANAEAEKLRLLAEKMAIEKSKTQLDAMNQQLQTDGIAPTEGGTVPVTGE